MMRSAAAIANTQTHDVTSGAARRRLCTLAAQLAAPDGLQLCICSEAQAGEAATTLREYVPPVIDLTRLGGGPAEL
eukprot:SAG31_NODE_42920_length_269_cov_0.911765_1_plen_75_part_01